MTNTGLSKFGLRILDGLTDRDPVRAPRIFERLLTGICGSAPVYPFYRWKYSREWDADCAPKKILLIVDVCLGDAVLTAQVLTVLRQYFPQAELHYACNKTGGELIDGMPGVQVHPIIQGKRGFPTEEDLRLLRATIQLESFSLILNLSPFISKRALGGSDATVLQLYVPFATYTLRAWQRRRERHISFLARRFTRDFLTYSGFTAKAQTGSLNTNTVYLSAHAIETAEAFLHAHDLRPGGLLFFNPDATSQYGQMPFDVQLKILREAAKMSRIKAVLLAKAHTARNIEQRLVAEMPFDLRDRIVIVPYLPIEAFVAITDACDMFISGDTGPLHVAACWKMCADRELKLRNRTAVLAIYGATDSKMYGYDSFQAYHVPAAQQAPSRSFSAPGATCRNISCINKFGKFCAEVRCFKDLPIDEIAHYIGTYFNSIADDKRLEPPLDLELIPDRVLTA